MTQLLESGHGWALDDDLTLAPALLINDVAHREIGRLKAEVERLAGLRSGYEHEIGRLTGLTERLAEMNRQLSIRERAPVVGRDRLRQALRWYANERHYRGPVRLRRIFKDGGGLARQALSDYREVLADVDT